MTFNDLAALGSFISGVGVPASLIFLYFQMRQVTEQVRQAEKNQRATIRTGRAARIIEMNIGSLDPAVATAIYKCQSGAPDVTAAQFAQYSASCRAMFYNAEDTYFQYRNGLLDEEAFQSFTASVRGFVKSAGLRAMWTGYRELFVPEFVAWVDALIDSVPLTPASDAFERWKSEVTRLQTAS